MPLPRLTGGFLAFTLILPLLSALPAEAAPPEIGRKVGQMYPDFALPDLDGKMRRLSDFRGRKVFLFHFASW